jgi:PIN domain nuclease of toxin-antitoxin system
VNLLLDTHAAIWWIADDERFGKVAEQLVLDPDARVLFSAVVMWEVTIKRRLGKLTVPDDWSQQLLNGGAVELPISLAHAAKVGDLPDHHRDPFDRLLVAQALIEDATLISRDRALAAYDVPVAW